MTTEKHDPWALLREARMFVALSGYGKASLARIDAALAEHDTVPPSEEKVEWKTEMGLHATTVNGVNIAVFPMTEDGRWTAALHVADPFDTLDEAQRAALSAARGMR